MALLVTAGILLVHDRVRWPIARDHCLSIGGRLLEPRTQGEVTEAVSMLVGDVDKIWIGGYHFYAPPEGGYVWDTDGSAVDVNQFWKENEAYSTLDFMLVNTRSQFTVRSHNKEYPFACKLN